MAGAGFAGFAAWLDMSPADSDMFGIPDPDSLIQLPWNKEVGWLASDLWMNGKPVEASPRVMLKNQIKKLEKKGLTMKSGVECEYFLITPDGNSIADPRDTQSKPCYDQSALMRRYDLIKEICDCMIEMGWGPYQNDHEDANGQFEMNWDYDDCLLTADRHTFFKFMVKTIAEKHGLRATFMPKPFENLTGNGCHAHISVWDGSKNKFLDKSDNLGLSKMAYNFLGGVIKNASSLSAFFNPTNDVGKTGKVTLIYAGGVRDGADMAKALALGADAIAIGTGSMIALNCNKDIPEANFEKEMGVKAGECYHCHTGRCPVGVATQDPKLRARLNPDDAALRVYNYLHSMTLEAQLLARACGKTNIHSLEPEDLAALTSEASALAKVPLAGTNYTVGVDNYHKI